MALADVVVAKAGPAVVMEALVLHKPLVITHYIWKQEKGNVDFVLRQGVGLYEPVPSRVPDRVEEILRKGTSTEAMRQNGQSLRLENGTEAIAEFIWRLGSA